MIWLGWRQQRSETLLAAAILAALAAVLIPTGLSMSSAYDHGHLAGCLAFSSDDSCRAAVDAFFGKFENLSHLIAWVTLIPGLIGILLAAPFVLQLERRTHWLDWTQSITRGRWIAGKIGLAVATALVAAAALTLLVTWWRGPFVHLQGRMENSVYDSEGTVVAAYTVFALGIGLAVGAVWRNAVPALIVSFAGYFAVRLFVDTWLRQRLISPVTVTFDGKGKEPAAIAKAWVLSEHPIDRHGHAINFIACPPDASACAAKPGAVPFIQAVYHPASHFWPLQLVETGMFAAAAIALIAFAAWWTHRGASS
jgi:hypothetical protein